MAIHLILISPGCVNSELYFNVVFFHIVQAEEQQTLLREKRKKERQKVLAKKRNLEGLVKDAQKRSADFERKVIMY